MDYKRPLKKSWVVDPQTKWVMQQRDHEYLMPYCPTLMLASPCNNNVNLMYEVSRWLREFHQWVIDREKGLNMDTPQPALPTLEAAAAIAAEYASKYASKPDNIDVNTNATLLATELIAAREANVGAPPASLK